MPKSIPTIGQQNWGETLNAHLAQLINPLTGGLNSGDTASRPNSVLTADRAEMAGYTYFDTTTKELLKWSGTNWEVMMKDSGGIAITQPNGTPVLNNVRNISFSNASVSTLVDDSAVVSMGANVASSGYPVVMEVSTQVPNVLRFFGRMPDYIANGNYFVYGQIIVANGNFTQNPESQLLVQKPLVAINDTNRTASTASDPLFSINNSDLNTANGFFFSVLAQNITLLTFYPIA